VGATTRLVAVLLATFFVRCLGKAGFLGVTVFFVFGFWAVTFTALGFAALATAGTDFCAVTFVTGFFVTAFFGVAAFAVFFLRAVILGAVFLDVVGREAAFAAVLVFLTFGVDGVFAIRPPLYLKRSEPANPVSLRH
jgi:hypothetical protein